MVRILLSSSAVGTDVPEVPGVPKTAVPCTVIIWVFPGSRIGADFYISPILRRSLSELTSNYRVFDITPLNFDSIPEPEHCPSLREQFVFRGGIRPSHGFSLGDDSIGKPLEIVVLPLPVVVIALSDEVQAKGNRFVFVEVRHQPFAGVQAETETGKHTVGRTREATNKKTTFDNI